MRLNERMFLNVQFQFESSLGNLGRVLGALPGARPALFFKRERISSSKAPMVSPRAGWTLAVFKKASKSTGSIPT